MSDTPFTVPAAEANRAFSRILRVAREGRSVTITSHGEPVAVLMPVGEVDASRRHQAHDALMSHLRALAPVLIEPWTRDDLYERD
ncbi:MAG: type II toxin-antitoxin system prevent-host-death family antitoxin [Caulobacteraceae bacterium]|nr:type II toxin-antitoxin system prevent-host-death family antitoxin [Caulobacteraceae bacterium]